MTGAIALLAGGDPARSGLLAVAMFGLQASIGTVNDLVDRTADAATKPGKPLVANRVSEATARVVAAGGLALGLALSASFGPPVLVVALLGTGAGYVYDVRLKGTAWAWLPFSLGVPLLLVYAWAGAGAEIPGAFVVLLPAAIAGGAALALGNQLQDLVADIGSGLDSTVRHLGPAAAWATMAGLYAGVTLAALSTLVILGGRGPGIGLTAAGAGVLATGLLLARRPGTAARRGSWELQAVGLGLLAAGWVAALADAGALES